MNSWLVPDEFMACTRWIHGSYQMNSWRVPDEFVACTRWIHGVYQMNSWLVPDEFMACTRRIHDLYQMNPWLVSDESMACTRWIRDLYQMNSSPDQVQQLHPPSTPGCNHSCKTGRREWDIGEGYFFQPTWLQAQATSSTPIKVLKFILKCVQSDCRWVPSVKRPTHSWHKRKLRRDGKGRH